MEISKKSEASSISLIVAAVIGLLILVVIIAMLSGKFGAFGKGASTAGGCDNICNGAGYGGSGSVEHSNLKDSVGDPCSCAT